MVFDKAHEIKIRIIIIVCLIAVSRKVLVMDTHKSDPLSDLAIA
ncbi:MAG: phosphate-starvation-inducible PsiE family protein, partial [Bacteroidota bacterium]